jgi:LDH2 family malate/lactate/ureidoglycolate dehydrogenase
MRPDLFRPRDTVLADLTRHLDSLRDAGSTDGRPVRLPGDEAARVRAENQERGVPLSDSLVNELHDLAGELGVGSPFTKAETR